MTETQRVYLKLSIAGLAAVGIFVLSAFWLGGLYSWFIGLLGAITVANVALAMWSFRVLGSRIRGLDEADAEAARESYFKRFPWLRGKRKRAKPIVEGGARKRGARPLL